MTTTFLVCGVRVRIHGLQRDRSMPLPTVTQLGFWCVKSSPILLWVGAKTSAEAYTCRGYAIMDGALNSMKDSASVAISTTLSVFEIFCPVIKQLAPSREMDCYGGRVHVDQQTLTRKKLIKLDHDNSTRWPLPSKLTASTQFMNFSLRNL